MTKLSVNINKIATLRNARGGDVPNLVEAAKNIESYGAEGITVHPRPDERHIRYADVHDLKPVLTTEFNIEGKPIQQFIDLVLEAAPAQVTLVPDAEDAITSNAGWDTIKHKEYLKEVIAEFKYHGIRTSIFVDPEKKMIEGAAETGTDRIELYTESFAVGYARGDKNAVKPYAECAGLAHKLGLGVNAGHDLSLQNLKFFNTEVPHLAEVSIGHALISEALYMGLEKTIQEYLKLLK
ncbi:pyridoxine 5'-phosphate synthase [Christiangramia sabulilitoris]|uniref:Pyridoxine 5'-phosphate synthase n=1 Tax=Christiangramia sabulilitoris TaxID=2583991 RepID=A0A550HZT8_9FLAO|nr:pyridoxine 5'-phosphate synthase [Christiangramia sabulilitoris]TRO64200.1 pyridoxine 5'-phosphate synthase [Christiangramia sabulilitoris]